MTEWTHKPAPPGPADWASDDDFLDGNAAAGPLADLFAMEVTAARGRCEGCGSVSAIATAHLYPHPPGIVLRCATCSAVLLRVVERDNRICLDLRGLSYLEFDRG